MIATTQTHTQSLYDLPIYTELNHYPLDIPALAQRCELFSDLLMDCKTPEQMPAILRGLLAYLDAIQLKLESPPLELELSAAIFMDEMGHSGAADSDLMCSYCQSLTRTLLAEPDQKEATVLMGLLHELVSYLLDDIPLWAVQPSPGGESQGLAI